MSDSLITWAILETVARNPTFHWTGPFAIMAHRLAQEGYMVWMPDIRRFVLTEMGSAALNAAG